MTTINADLARIQEHTIDLDQLLAMSDFPECGGLAMFVGTVRNHHQGKSVKSLKYTAYKPLAEKMIRAIEQDIAEKYAIPYVRVVHRIGHLEIGEVAIYAVARAEHRREAFAACEDAVERVKHEVPVWKQEFYHDGTSIFVEGCCIRRDVADIAQEKHHHVTHEHCNHD
ncbi:molybdenum cofactor biosynthesis protein MoaE [Acinetobacter populi]|jgi:molybdopterin synthase catalytic subunit|uniref:molybdenum cofactor biosynthesis protein MoaE n=1 Tax=Acinetobacter populi TaxID=1582270 RepID=UPI002354E61B|nr:molybdenum cofactor biosynthesis protein MoaE [Acinetobacter populi]